MSGFERKSLEVLALGNPSSSAFSSQMHALRMLGRLTFRSEGSFENKDDFIAMLMSAGYDLVLMPNPYGNEVRQAFYEELRRRNLPVLVFDRGGLPRSWFFDIGFNADSETYEPSMWDHSLSAEAKDKVDAYIASIKESDVALESQGSRERPEALKERLGLNGKKVLFVPFQRPKDTTVQHFGNGANSFNRFLAAVIELDDLLHQSDSDWRIVVKKHPLESQRPTNRLIFADDESHINDLLEMCDSVALINSGVGLLASLFGKPVYNFGRIYYGHPQLNRGFASATELKHFLEYVPVDFDGDVRDRLVHYLISQVYSFGDFTTEVMSEGDGALRRVMRSITFDEVRFPLSRLFEKKKVGSVFFL